MPYVMWEAKAQPGRTDALLAWAQQHAPATAQLYRNAERVVVIAEDLNLADVPDDLIVRPAYSWEFERVR